MGIIIATRVQLQIAMRRMLHRMDSRLHGFESIALGVKLQLLQGNNVKVAPENSWKGLNITRFRIFSTQAKY